MNGLKEVLIKRKENGINDLEEKVNQEADVIDKYSKRVETLSQLDRLQVQRMEKSYRDFSQIATIAVFAT